MTTSLSNAKEQVIFSEEFSFILLLIALIVNNRYLALENLHSEPARG
jgi:hypothetical protein